MLTLPRPRHPAPLDPLASAGDPPALMEWSPPYSKRHRGAKEEMVYFHLNREEATDEGYECAGRPGRSNG